MNSPAPDALAKLRQVYSQKLPAKFQELDDAVSAIHLGADDWASALENLQGLCHKLAGSSPTFGYPAVGQAARAVEQACIRYISGEEVFDQSALKNLAQDIVSIRQADAAATETVAEEAPTVVAPPPEESQSTAGRVLVVEDEPSQAMFVQIVLKKAGVDVETQADPLLVLDQLRDFKPDLIYLDMNMPGMDGDELARLIRSAEGGVADIPIVFLSGEEDHTRRQQALEAGGNGFIDKPVNPSTLIETTRKFLGRSS